MEDMSPDLGGLGQELRQLRKSRGLRIADLAARMQRSTGWISQVERGRSRVGYEDLAAFAHGFEISVSQLFRRGLGETVADDRVARQDDRRAIETGAAGIVADLLAADAEVGLEMYRSVVAGRAAARQSVRRKGLQMGYIESGRIDFWFDGKHRELAQGDSFRIKGESLDWLNPYPDPCTLIWVLAPLVRGDDG